MKVKFTKTTTVEEEREVDLPYYYEYSWDTSQGTTDYIYGKITHDQIIEVARSLNSIEVQIKYHYGHIYHGDFLPERISDQVTFDRARKEAIQFIIDKV